MDPITVLQQAQLFQALDLLQRRGPEPGKLKQEIATVDIKSEMTITPKPPLDARASGFARRIDPCIYYVRNRRPGKINRAVDAIGENLDDVGIPPFFFLHDRRAHGALRERSVAPQRHNRLGDRRRMNKREIALYVHQPIRLDLARHFRQTVRAACVMHRGQHHFAAEGAHRVDNSLIVGCHHHAIQDSSLRRALVNMLDHRLAADLG
jgi:hypothetical protein